MLRLERAAWSMVKRLRRATNEYTPPPGRLTTSGFRYDAAPHPSRDSLNTSQRFALGASNVRLVGEDPTGSVPALQRCEGRRPYDYNGHVHMILFFPLPSDNVQHDIQR